MSVDASKSLLGDHLPVPREMESMPRWVRYRLVPTKNGRPRKVPTTLSGRPADVTDPDNWADYFDALWTRRGDGLGFVLGEGVGCIDLDDALTAQGDLTAWAGEILARAPKTFVEVSQSGTGLHVWGRLDEAPGRNLRNKGKSVEVYSQGRFIALGRTLWPDSVGRLADLTELAEELTA